MTNICNCQHKGCTRTTTAPEFDNWTRITLKNRGGRSAYLCPYHADNDGNSGYTFENNMRRGGEKSHGFTASFEFEMEHSDATMRAELLNVGFVPTSDVTTGCEFKSPIYNSFNPMPKKFQTIEQLLNYGHGIIGAGDGTHCHIGHVEHINPETMRQITRFYHSLFVPLSDAMQADTAATVALFGRDFNRWACAIDRNSVPDNHANFINVEHDYTLEFRICKFRSAAQYMEAVRFCRAATECIINNFVLHFNDDKPNMLEHRRHKAAITGNKLVKLFKKHAAAAARF